MSARQVITRFRQQGKEWRTHVHPLTSDKYTCKPITDRSKVLIH